MWEPEQGLSFDFAQDLPSAELALSPSTSLRTCLPKYSGPGPCYILGRIRKSLKVGVHPESVEGPDPKEEGELREEDARIGSNYLQSVLKMFKYTKTLGERALSQVEEEEIHWQLNEEVNSIEFFYQGKKYVYKRLEANLPHREADHTEFYWVREVINGPMSLYYGYQPDFNTPSYNAWFCKKAVDKSAYGIVMYFSTNNFLTYRIHKQFKENALEYFKDDAEIIEKLERSEYGINDLKKMVTAYNQKFESL